jgi:hypothetical protein
VILGGGAVSYERGTPVCCQATSASTAHALRIVLVTVPRVGLSYQQFLLRRFDLHPLRCRRRYICSAPPRNIVEGRLISKTFGPFRRPVRPLSATGIDFRKCRFDVSLSTAFISMRLSPGMPRKVAPVFISQNVFTNQFRKSTPPQKRQLSV